MYIEEKINQLKSIFHMPLKFKVWKCLRILSTIKKFNSEIKFLEVIQDFLNTD